MKFIKHILVSGLMAAALGHCAYASDAELLKDKSPAVSASVPVLNVDIEDKTAEKPKAVVTPALKTEKADSTSTSSCSLYFWNFFSYTKNKLADVILLGVCVAENVTTGSANFAACSVTVGKMLANYVIDTSAFIAKCAIDTTESGALSAISLTKRAAEYLKVEQPIANKAV